MTVPGGPSKVIEDVLKREFGIDQAAARKVTYDILDALHTVRYEVRARMLSTTDRPYTARTSTS
jgi:hypothetical protein